jgi:hypothetical protein
MEETTTRTDGLMKKKSRLTSSEQIIRKIELFAMRKLDKEKQIMDLLREARIARYNAQTMGDDEELKTAQRMERKAEAIGKRVVVLSRKLSVLKDKLAEFQTEVIPGFLPDNSVEAP